MSIHLDILKALGLTTLPAFIELGWHGNEWDDNGATYRWNAELQQAEYLKGRTWQRSKWTTHILLHLQNNVDFDLADWDEEDGPYQKWAVYCAVRKAGITLLQLT